ncbi:MAG: hypothetical protein OEY97_01895 [Nitrospirota bacterium]|nr:hypothetical protein [Nitrospirota bacterium]
MGDRKQQVRNTAFLSGALAVLVLAACTVSPTEPVNPPDEIEAVSLNSNGVIGNGASFTPALNSDGRYVAFASDATDLVVPADGNGVTDIYRRDRLVGTTIRLSVTDAGLEANGASLNPSLSASGQVAGFQSDATNLVIPADTGTFTDVFIHAATTTRRVSVNTLGNEPNGNSTNPSVSANGKVVAFQSDATDLESPSIDTGVFTDVFVHATTTTGATTRISVSATGTEPNGNSTLPSISGDGSRVVFQSDATNLILPADGNGFTNIYLRDTVGAATYLVSKSPVSNKPANGASTNPVISTDGNFIAFQSTATDLGPAGANATEDIFLCNCTDPANPSITRISESRTNADGNGASINPAINANGNYVAFESTASNLVPGDSNGKVDLFIYANTSTKSLTRVSVDKYGVQVTDGDSSQAALSGTGLVTAFQTDSAQMLANDTNGQSDVLIAPTP